jgi:AraC-like DNA-binding protein
MPEVTGQVRKLSRDRFMKEEFPFWIKRTSQGSISEHGHDFVELVYVVHGNGTHRFEGRDYDIQAGDVFIINPGETHSYSVSPNDSIEIINCLFMPAFIPDTLLRELDICNSMDYFYVHPFLTNDLRFNHRLNVHGQDAANVLELLVGMLREIGGNSIGFKTILRLQLIELLILLSRFYTLLNRQGTMPTARQQESMMMVRRIYGYMERNFDKKITLQTLGDLFNVSTRHVNRLMRQEFGRSVIDLLHDIRIGRAKHMLMETNEKVIVVATMVGYDDPSFFNRLFHRHVGCSPSQYRTGLAVNRKQGGEY